MILDAMGKRAGKRGASDDANGYDLVKRVKGIGLNGN